MMDKDAKNEDKNTTKRTVPEREQRLRAALSALMAAMPGARRRRGTTAEGIERRVTMLETGRDKKKDGRDISLSLAATARVIVQLIRAGAADRVPQAARDRFPWGAVSRDVLTSLAEAGGVDPVVFLRALGVSTAAASPAPAVATPVAPAAPASAKPAAPASAKPAAPVASTSKRLGK
jgi:hypothetical protein